jgi:peptide-methionine (S)-S-oxide reductase
MPTSKFTHILPVVRRLSTVSLTVAAIAYIASQMMLPGTAADTIQTKAGTFPNPTTDIATSAGAAEQTAVFAGGCFWGMEGVFEHLKGVSDVTSGYSGGSAATAHYETVSSGETEHAESIQITYDPAQISYGQLLKIYFAVAHDPTELNRQGPDSGTQYRSAVFFVNDQQKQVAQAYIDQLNQAHVFRDPIVTQLVPFNRFYAAEDYHQNFIDRNPANPYVIVNDLPEIARLQSQFPDLYKP